jgi:K(+)-stimulated pyrophosphate-energized sodium pump
MAKLSAAIKKSAQVYLKRQYTGVARVFASMFAILLTLSRIDLVNPFVPFAFITGGVFSALSGFIGMSVATSSNARTAFAASESLNKGLRVAFSAGGVMGFTVVGLGLLDLSIWYYLLTYGFHLDIQGVTSAMLTFGMGASSMALFARVGGGIFTKAADVGADLVGKLEAGIPEDDPRNPAVIADNVGDNVGDVAGMGADLYESYVGSIVSTAALAVAANLGIKGVIIPMAMAAIGIIASIIGTFFVRSGEQLEQKALLAALRKGVYASSVLIVIAAFILVWFVLGKESIGIFFAIVSGLPQAS